MATLFASQLRTIALNSSHELDLRARRDAHAESLLFPHEVAAKQDFETIYATCYQGYRELCTLDGTLVKGAVRGGEEQGLAEFDRNLFSAQSVRTERDQMNKQENEVLDKVLERCLAMLGGKLLLNPGVKCLEWLVRRFRVHIHNTSALLLAVLPWHDMPIWRNVLSIVPKEKCVAEWKFLGLYKAGNEIETALNIPRTAIVFAMTNTDAVFAMVNRYVIEASKDGIAHPALLKFWNGIVLEAVMGRLDATRSGRKEVQRQRTEDFLLKVLPLLSDGLEIKGCPDVTTACFTLTIVLVGKADLEDTVLDSLLQAVAMAAKYPGVQLRTSIITITVILGRKQTRSMPKTVLDMFMSIPNLDEILSDLRTGYPLLNLFEALINTSMVGVKKRRLAERLDFVNKLITFADHLVPQSLSVVCQTVLAQILLLDANKDNESKVRAGLIDVMRCQQEEQNLSSAIGEASTLLNLDQAAVENLLGSTIAIDEAQAKAHSTIAVIEPAKNTSLSIMETLKALPTFVNDTSSFLAQHDQPLFSKLTECFALCYKTHDGVREFTELPIWKSSSQEHLLLSSFLLKMAISTYKDIQRSAALQLLSQIVQGHNGLIDSRSLFSFIVALLTDSSETVRKAAADLFIATENASSSADNDTAPSINLQNLYGSTDTADTESVTAHHFHKIAAQILIPYIEECVLDKTQIARIIHVAFNGIQEGSQISGQKSTAELKKPFKHDLFDLLTTQALAPSPTKIKFCIVKLLRTVNKIGSSTKHKALAPIWTWWSTCTDTEAAKAAESAQTSSSELDILMAELAISQEKDVVDEFSVLVNSRISEVRRPFVSALFEQVTKIWNDLKYEIQASFATKLFDLAFTNDTTLSSSAQGVLKSVSVPTNILGLLLERAMEDVPQLQSDADPPRKKRRTSHGKEVLRLDTARALSSVTSKVSFALELVEESSPESKPELLPVLFDIASILKRWRNEHKLNLPYLQNLCLNNLLAIVKAQQGQSKLTIDVSSIRGQLVADFIRSSESPQVQTTALLLASSLASISPSQMLHHIMPIFTFMGQSMFAKDDDHSIHVINQSIDMLIPALVETLRSQNKDLVRSMSKLLANFTAAFDHIPVYRRTATFARLLTSMGAQDFAFAIVAMLVQRKGHHVGFSGFLDDMLANFGPEVHLTTARRLIELSNDIASSKPQISYEIFEHLEEMSGDRKLALSEAILKTALSILESRPLRNAIGKLYKIDNDAAQRVSFEINSALKTILSTVQSRRRGDSEGLEEVKHCLDALLALPSFLELFAILQQMIADEDVEEDLKPQALRALAMKLQTSPAKDSITRNAAMEFLLTLTSVLTTSLDTHMKQAVLVCIDAITEAYGRKDVDAVVHVAAIVASDDCLGTEDPRLKVMSLLCLASILEVTKEACAPIIPELILQLITTLQRTLESNEGGSEVHDASFTLVSSIVSHASFLLSDDYICTILALASKAASKFNSGSSLESRREALAKMAEKIDLTTLLESFASTSYQQKVESSWEAETESLSTVSTALRVASKGAVVKNANSISRYLLSHLDQRSKIAHETDADDEEQGHAIVDLENIVHNVLIQFVYKLNDTAFRPIFESWIEWATHGHDIDDTWRTENRILLRRTSLFRLLTHFFDTLKSIVTSYASYIIPLAHKLLTSTLSFLDSQKSSHMSPTQINNHITLLTMIRSTFIHDADSFYSSPSHFEPIAAPLISQLKLASIKQLRNLTFDTTIPTIVSLAIATLDSPICHQSLSHELVQLRHHSSSAVRLASIKTFAAITADEDVSEEFIANVIGIGSGDVEGAKATSSVSGGGSVGEIMIYVNEMLEDDDEDVEREVRKWVGVVREKTGEDVFEV